MATNTERFAKYMEKKGFKLTEKVKDDERPHYFNDPTNPSSSHIKNNRYIYSGGFIAVGLFGNDDEVYHWTSKKFSEQSDSERAECADRIKIMKSVYATAANVLSGVADSVDDENSDEATVKRLAKLSEFDYDRVRKREAKKLNINASTLDRAVRIARKLSFHFVGR